MCDLLLAYVSTNNEYLQKRDKYWQTWYDYKISEKHSSLNLKLLKE